MNNIFAFFFINTLSVIALYSFVSRSGSHTVSGKVVSVGVLFSAQIVLTELVLSLGGFLYPGMLFCVNLIIALILLIMSVYKRIDVFVLIVRRDVSSLRDSFQSILSPTNCFFLIAIALLFIWFVLASFLLPPRGVDDLGYHLPIVYEAVIHHRISLLPVAYLPYFAYPANAELLKLWPTIFFHNIHWIGLIQFISGIWSAVIIYALAQRLKDDKKTSFFIAVQFLFAPVVLAQMGSGYIEVITAAFFLAALYFAVQFHFSNKDIDVYLLGITLGLMLGMKYSMWILVASIGIFIVPAILRRPKSTLLVFCLLILLTGGYWYVRNFIMLGNPVYPMDVSQRGFGFFDVPPEFTFDPLEFVLVNGKKFSLLFVNDLGLGSLNGGLGLIFWGIAFPSWIYVLITSLRNLLKKEVFPFFLWTQLLTGMAMIVLIPITRLMFNVRQSLFMIPVALLAMAEVIPLLKARSAYFRLLSFSCCFVAVSSMILLAKTHLPSYAVDVPIQDILKNKTVSQNRYLQLSARLPEVSFSYEALDFLTRDDRVGLSCYYASAGNLYRPAPIYGMNLQNHVWNFKKDISKPPEALIFYFSPRAAVVYMEGRKITLEDTFENPNYNLVASTKLSNLYIQRSFFERENKRRLLAEFYESHFSSEIGFLEKTMPPFDPGVPILASTDWGMVFKYFYLMRRIANPVYLVPDDCENKFAAGRQDLKAFYTINKDLEHFDYSVIYEKTISNKPFKMYLNVR